MRSANLSWRTLLRGAGVALGLPWLEAMAPSAIASSTGASADTGGGNYVKESSILTCTTISKTLGVDVNIHGVLMDQLAAQRVGEQTPLPSLELGIEPESTGVDGNAGYTRVYGCHIVSECTRQSGS
jgi:hypothetical protein